MNCPSIAVAGLGGDSGKTLVSLGLAAAFSSTGRRIAPFKKGPDYIDAAWLTAAAGRVCRNLDTFLMDETTILSTWNRECARADLAVLEGNRGIYDGMDAVGSHSTATLAKLLGAPVILVINVTKMTRTVAAIVKGVQALDPELDLLGVVLNRVAGQRHQRVITEAIELETGLPVLGAIPKLKLDLIPGRHLGLVTTDEHPDVARAIANARDVALQYLNMDRIEVMLRQRVGSAGPTPPSVDAGSTHSAGPPPPPVTDTPTFIRYTHRVGVVRDEAFPFYYPENLEALEDNGAELVYCSALKDSALPDDLDALYIGGGFPETHLPQLAANKAFLDSLRRAALETRLPIYAECGGLMLLCGTLAYEGQTWELANVFPVDIGWSKKPRGHGYSVGVVDHENPFYPVGAEIKGHEFHYSFIEDLDDSVLETSAVSLSRGSGIGEKRDGLQVANTLALYTHVHAAGLKEWAQGIRAACARTR